MPPEPKLTDTTVQLPTDDPVKILVDFQSVHHAAFRLFTMAAAGGAWVLLNEGQSDSPARLLAGVNAFRRPGRRTRWATNRPLIAIPNNA